MRSAEAIKAELDAHVADHQRARERHEAVVCATEAEAEAHNSDWQQFCYHHLVRSTELQNELKAAEQK